MTWEGFRGFFWRVIAREDGERCEYELLSSSSVPSDHLRCSVVVFVGDKAALASRKLRSITDGSNSPKTSKSPSDGDGGGSAAIGGGV